MDLWSVFIYKGTSLIYSADAFETKDEARMFGEAWMRMNELTGCRIITRQKYMSINSITSSCMSRLMM